MNKRFCFRSDDDGHWYIMPTSKADRFDEIMSMGEAGEDLFFEEGFDEFRIDGGPEGYSFTDHEVF